MNSKKPKQVQQSQTEDESESNDRTEVHGEYKGGKIRVLFGRHGTAITWAIAWAVALLSTVLAAGMAVTIIENLKRLGVIK